MEAAILAVGSELLGVDRLDTNSLTLTRVLEEYGVRLRFKAVLPDDIGAIAAEVVEQTEEGRLVLITGGLGPTADDVTREALARACTAPLVVVPSIVDSIRRRFERAGLVMSSTNEKQAQVPLGATVIENRRGTAPGLRIERPGAPIFVFPGVPDELEGMIESDLRPWLASTAAEGIERRVVKVACLPESALEERIVPAYEEFGRENITVLAKPAEIHVWVTAAGSAAARKTRLETMQAAILDLIGDFAYSAESECELEDVVVGLLRDRLESVSTAESCTGGLLGGRITAVSGSSEVYPGGAIAYSNRLKQEVLGVAADVLDRKGAVSEEVAAAMASGAAERFSTDWGIGITGIAGPNGGSTDKPVGTVMIAVAGQDEPICRTCRFHGNRATIRNRSTQMALDMFRRRLLGLSQLP